MLKCAKAHAQVVKVRVNLIAEKLRHPAAAVTVRNVHRSVRTNVMSAQNLSNR